jgi:hypothetical protein
VQLAPQGNQIFHVLHVCLILLRERGRSMPVHRFTYQGAVAIVEHLRFPRVVLLGQVLAALLALV